MNFQKFTRLLSRRRGVNCGSSYLDLEDGGGGTTVKQLFCYRNPVTANGDSAGDKLH